MIFNIYNNNRPTVSHTLPFALALHIRIATTFEGVYVCIFTETENRFRSKLSKKRKITAPEKEVKPREKPISKRRRKSDGASSSGEADKPPSLVDVVPSVPGIPMANSGAAAGGGVGQQPESSGTSNIKITTTTTTGQQQHCLLTKKTIGATNTKLQVWDFGTNDLYIF